jgi:signal transduction histidine kinase
MSPVLWLGVGLVVLGMALLAAVLWLGVRWRVELAEARRERDHANAIKNDFVAMVSHELRTPLTSIAGFAQTLADHWRDLPPEEVDEFLTYITKQAHLLGDLVEDILVIPRLEAGRLRLDPVLFDLSELVHEVSATVFPPGEGREAAVSVPGGVRAYGDPRRVYQVVRNLLENARKYGGEQVLVEGFPYGDHFVVVISDNGPGVPDQAVNLIFEHFEQLSKGDSRSSSGIGLGLPIARRLARAMGGDVWYERRFPTGSRFCFSITVSPEAHERVMAQREQQEQETTNRRRTSVPV